MAETEVLVTTLLQCQTMVLAYLRPASTRLGDAYRPKSKPLSTDLAPGKLADFNTCLIFADAAGGIGLRPIR